MRLARLDLTRYGKFTGASLDFGAARPGVPDLHLVYGPNEAGKSTAFAGFLDLLFGIEPQSGYNFVHSYETMKVGAALELGGKPPRQFGRVKKRQNTLIDAADQPVGEAGLLGSLGGLDRAAYRHMFSLDDETLEKGGQAILASKGNLGELLFSASAGLAELGQTLEALRAEADLFYRGRARSTELGDLKDKLAALKTERDALDTALPAYRELVKTYEASRKRSDEALAERARLQAQAHAVERRLQVLPRFHRLLGLRERLAASPDVPQSPAHWGGELPALQRQEIALSTQLDGCTVELAKLITEVEAVVVDQAALDLGARIDLVAKARDRFTTAEEDLPNRRRSLADQEAKLAVLLRRIDREGEPDPERLLLGASALGALRDLIERRSGIAAKLDTARSQHADAEQDQAGADAALIAAGGAPEGTGDGTAALRSVLAAVRGGDHAQRRRGAELASAKLRDALDTELAALRPWHGSVAELAAGTAPRAGDVARWKATEADLARDLAQHAAEIDRLSAERGRLVAERDAAGQFAGVVSEAEAAEIRQRREAAWAAHRGALRPETADLFEAALRHDDLVTAARLTRSGEMARLAQVGQTLALRDADLAAVTARQSTAREARDRLAAELRQAIDRLGWPAGASLPAADLLDWLKGRTACLDLAERLRAEERAITAAEADAREAQERLAAALTAAGARPAAAANLTDLLAEAEAIVERDSRLAGLRSQAADRRVALAKRTRDLAKAETDDTAWQTAWVQACDACWLGEGGATPAVGTVRAILDSLGGLETLLVQRADLRDRIGKMEADQARYGLEVDRLAAELGAGDLPSPTLDRAAALAQRLATAREAAAHAQSLRARHTEIEIRRAGLQGEQAVNRKQAAAMMAFFGVESLDEVAVRLDEAKTRTELVEAAREAEADIVMALGAATPAEAEALLQAADRTALEAERDALQPRLDDLDQRTRTLFADAARAEDALAAVGGDDQVARLAERRRTLLLDTEEKARRHLGLRIGIAAAEQALRAYRDKHRSTMMQRASQAFRTISRGAYHGLATQPGNKGEVLVAIGPDSSKEADKLSKGTRFQLYLALRVAGYYEHCLAREPVPFVADDIMETFDDFRAEEAFRLFAGMAEVGQVIYLTHHRHLIDIARAVCPEVRVTELPTAA